MDFLRSRQFLQALQQALEASELRDGDEKRFHGKGVLKAINQINQVISPHIASKSIEVIDQETLDNELINLDGTENKSHLGGNSILAVSIAVSKAAALSQGIALHEWIQSLATKIGIVKNRNKIPTPLLI
jgi:enolase